MPAARRGAAPGGDSPRSACESARGFLGDLTSRHRAHLDQAAGEGAPRRAAAPERFTLAMLLEALGRSEQSLSSEEHRATAGTFDTFGPFDTQGARAALDSAIARWGNNRHLSAYLRVLVESQLNTTNRGLEP